MKYSKYPFKYTVVCPREWEKYGGRGCWGEITPQRENLNGQSEQNCDCPVGTFANPKNLKCGSQSCARDRRQGFEPPQGKELTNSGNSELMNQEIKASNKRKEMEGELVHLWVWSPGKKEKKPPLENENHSPALETGLDFEFILQQGLRKPKPRMKCKEIPGRGMFGTPGWNNIKLALSDTLTTGAHKLPTTNGWTSTQKSKLQNT